MKEDKIVISLLQMPTSLHEFRLETAVFDMIKFLKQFRYVIHSNVDSCWYQLWLPSPSETWVKLAQTPFSKPISIQNIVHSFYQFP